MLQVGERPTRNKGQRCFLKSRGREDLADGFTPRVQCEGPLRLVACGCIHENAPEEPARKGRTVPGRGRQGQPCEGTEGAWEEGEVHPGRKAAWAAVVTDSDVLSYRRGHFPTVQERAAVSESCCRSGISSSEKNVLPKMKNRNEYSFPRGNGLL